LLQQATPTQARAELRYPAVLAVRAEAIATNLTTTTATGACTTNGQHICTDEYVSGVRQKSS
jgi:hypothetical protein